jgi:hypothetical protein
MYNVQSSISFHAANLFPWHILTLQFYCIVVIPPGLMILSGLKGQYPYVYIMTCPSNFEHWIMYPFTFTAVT